MIETLRSTELLTKEGLKSWFIVMMIINGKRLENAGAVAIMPLAAPSDQLRNTK